MAHSSADEAGSEAIGESKMDGLERFPLDLNRKGYRGFPRACKSDSVPPTTPAGVGDGEGLLERPAGAGRLDRRGG